MKAGVLWTAVDIGGVVHWMWTVSTATLALVRRHRTIVTPACGGKTSATTFDLEPVTCMWCTTMDPNTDMMSWTE